MTTVEITHNRFTWTNIIAPDADDVERLRLAQPYIHPLNLEDLTSPLERPKIDEQDEYLFVVMHFPVWDAAHRLSRASEIEFIVGRNFLVTAHDGTLKALNQLFERCQQDADERQKIMGRGANDAFYVIVDVLVDYIFPILRKVDGNIQAIEEDIFTSDARQIIQDIAIARRDIIALRRIIRHQVPIVEQLEATEHPIMREELEEYFGDTVDHLHKARDIIDENAEIITGLSDTANTLANHRINEVMRVLTVISVIMLPLTLVSGIYGMNFEVLPLDNHPFGFLVIIGLMVTLAVSMLIYFRRRHWL
ncbi:MAG: magnesium/cobalt transporter CorA [Anaerolineaceae bacterium]|nr:magnesium/cobalt transporter CorA [Anaerolineaceae bacterium]